MKGIASVYMEDSISITGVFSTVQEHQYIWGGGSFSTVQDRISTMGVVQ